jgi:tRNA(Ile)-lysidine synthase
MDPVSTVRGAVALTLTGTGQDLIGVACSGGPDSMALADATVSVAGASRVVLLHVDHALRADSVRDAELVASWADRVNVTCHVVRVQVEPGASLEDAARRARYAVLGRLARRLGVAWVLTAHTARDQAETVIMRILRGAGPGGLAGIPPRRSRYLRPLLDIPRSVVDAYVEARALPTVVDLMNSDPRFTRSRVRHQILPLLARENPRIEEALCRLADSAREWSEAIDAAADKLVAGELDCKGIAEAPAAVAKRALARAAAATGLSPEAVHLEALRELCALPSAGTRTLDLPGGRAVRIYDRLQFVPATAPTLSPPGLAVDGPDGPYEIRPWRPGDRMRPPRLGGRSRKLSDLFTDARVPRGLRSTARVVVRSRDGAIVWAEHLGPAHGASVDVTASDVDRPEGGDRPPRPQS